MIIKALFSIITFLIGLIPFNIPSFPADISNFLTTFQGYITSAIGFVKFFLPWSYVIILLQILVGITIALELYKFLMWILRKVPMLSMKD